MKRNIHLAFLGAATALSLAVAPATLCGQDRSTAADPADQSKAGRAESMRSDKMLGHCERANKLIAKHVLGSDDQKLGKIDNLIVDLESGRILYAVISTSAIGGKIFAVAPGVFTDIR